MDFYPDLRHRVVELGEFVTMNKSCNSSQDTFSRNIAIRNKQDAMLSTNVYADNVLVNPQPILHGIVNPANPIESHLSQPITLMGVKRWFRADVLANALHHLHTTKRRREILIHVPDLDFRVAKMYCQQVPTSEIQRMRSAHPDLKSARIRLGSSAAFIGTNCSAIDLTGLDTWLAYRDALALAVKVPLRHRTHCIGSLTYHPQLAPFDGRPFDRPEIRMMDTLGNAIRSYLEREIVRRAQCFAGRTVVLSPAWRWSDGHQWASYDLLHEDIEDVLPGAPPPRTNLWQSLPPELRQLILQNPLGPLDGDRRLVVHSQPVMYSSASDDVGKAVDAHIGLRSDLAIVSRGFRTYVFATAISLWRSTPTVPQIRCHVLDLNFTGAEALCAQFTSAQIMRINDPTLPDQTPVIRLRLSPEFSQDPDTTPLDDWLTFRASQPAASTVPVSYETECIDSLPWDIRSLLAAGAALPVAETEKMAKLLTAINDYALLNMGSKFLGDEVIEIKRAVSKFSIRIWINTDPDRMEVWKSQRERWRQGGSWLPASRGRKHRAHDWQ